MLRMSELDQLEEEILYAGRYWNPSSTLYIEGAHWSGANWQCDLCKHRNDRFGIVVHLKRKHDKSSIVLGCRLRKNDKKILQATDDSKSR